MSNGIILRRACGVLLLFVLLAPFDYAEGAPRAKETKRSREAAVETLRKALAAMGGEDKLRGLRALYLEGVGHNFAVEQSERPEGPYIVAYEQIKETRDLAENRFRRQLESRQGQVPEWTGYTLVGMKDLLAAERGGRFFPWQKALLAEELMQLALAPEKVLLTALEAADLRADKDAVLQSGAQRVVRFTWQNAPVALYLNANSYLPTAVETKTFAAHSHFWQVWGDVATRTYFSYWTLEKGGWRYPRQTDTFRNEYPLRSFTVTALKANEPVAADAFNVPEDVSKAFAAQPLVAIDELPLGRPDQPAGEVAPGVVLLPGRWNVALVRQADGIVVVEAPISSGYSAKVLDEAKRRFPGLPVKAVVTTSDAFPHLGGVREYAAEGVPIYALDLNLPILQRLLKAPHTLAPDALERRPKKAVFRTVAGKTVVGEGANRLELYPFRTESGERMMMVYFPEHKLLYASDLVQKMRGGAFFMPQYLSEVIGAAERENLAVTDVFAMHTPKIAFAEIAEAVRRETAGN